MPLLKRQRPLTRKPSPSRTARPAGKKCDRGGGHAAAAEHPVETSLRQEDAERRNAGGTHHRAPAAGEIVVGQRFEHHHFGDRIGLGAADDGGQLQPEHAGIAQCADGLGGERSALLAFGTGRAQRACDASRRGRAAPCALPDDPAAMFRSRCPSPVCWPSLSDEPGQEHHFLSAAWAAPARGRGPRRCASPPGQAARSCPRRRRGRSPG